MIDPASFKIRFPEFAAVSDVKVQMFIDDSIVILNVAFWGEKYDLGLSYLAAHFLALSEKSEAGSALSVAPISGKAVDGVSVSYAQVVPANVADAMYASTMYGQRYLALRKTLGSPASVV